MPNNNGRGSLIDVMLFYASFNFDWTFKFKGGGEGGGDQSLEETTL